MTLLAHRLKLFNKSVHAMKRSGNGEKWLRVISTSDLLIYFCYYFRKKTPCTTQVFVSSESLSVWLSVFHLSHVSNILTKLKNINICTMNCSGKKICPFTTFAKY